MTKLLLPDLRPNTQYMVEVRAVRNNAASEWSPRSTFTTVSDTVLPLAPVNVTWAVSGDGFKGSWDATTLNVNSEVINVVRYEVELTANSQTMILSVPQTTGSSVLYSLSFEENRALFGTPQPTIGMRVRAVSNIDTKSAWTSILSASNPVPAAPTAVTATAGANQVALTWTAPADVDLIGYNVYSGATKLTFVNATSWIFYTSGYVSTTLTVKAVDKFGQESTGAASNAVTPTNPSTVDTTAPNTPTGLTAAITNNTNGIGARAAVSWTMASPPSDLAGYYVRYRKVGDTNYSNVTFSKDALAGTIELQSAFTNYEFQIKAFDWSNNESAWSATVTATSPANAAPSTVASMVSSLTSDSIVYSWTPVTDADLKNYEVTFSTSATFASGNTTFSTGTAATLSVGGLSPATTYYARVRAVDTSGAVSSAWSATNTTTTASLVNSVKNYSVEYSLAGSDTVAPTTGWSTTSPTRTPGSYIWTRTVVTYQDNTSSTTNPALLTGNTGSTGSQGIQGLPGSDGVSLYTWLKYADTPTTGMSDSPTGKTYMGIAYNKASSTESNVYSDYSWSLIKGADGSDGSDGIQGPPGADGQTTYTWVKYGDNASGAGLTDSPTGKTYIGLAFNKTTATESIVATDYTWSLIQGPQGVAGTPAATISLTATSQALIVPAGGGATTPTTSTVTGTAVNTTITAWTYSVDGAAFSATVPAGVSRAGNVVTITGSTMTAKTIAVKMADANGISDTLTVAKVSDGATGATGGTGGTGPAGADAYTVLLSNEAQVFAGTQTAANAGAVTTTVIAYKGTTQIAATIGTITGQVTGLTTAIVNNGTTTAGVTVTVTTALTTPTGVLTIPLTIDGKAFTQTFSWSVAFAGAAGATGGTGATGTSVTSITPFFAQLATGSAAPALPGNVATPSAPWVATEPTYVAGTELWTTNRVAYSNGTYAYTTVVKSSSYAAAVSAMQSASGKNTIKYSTVAPVNGTDNGILGDTWFVRDATTLRIKAQYELTTAPSTWTSRLVDGLIIANLDAGRLTAGTITGQTIQVASTGSIQSTDYAANSVGWKLSTAGLEINNGSVRASALTAGTLGSSTGVIQIGAGASIVMNGGYIKSNTNTGTTMATAVTSNTGFYLGNDGLFVGGGANGGQIKANALISDTLTSTTITLGAGGSIVGGSWTLNSSGLTIPNGAINAAALNIQIGVNLMPAKWADFESVISSYITPFPSVLGIGGSMAASITTVQKYNNSQSLLFANTSGGTRGCLFADSQTDYNIKLDPSTRYIISGYLYNASGAVVNGMFGVKQQDGTYINMPLTNFTNTAGWVRYIGSITTTAAATSGIVYFSLVANGTFYVDSVQIEKAINATVSAASPWTPPGSTMIDGSMIRTGSIQSTAMSQVYDPTTNTYSAGTDPAWSINTAGAANFSNATVTGSLVVGTSDPTQAIKHVVGSANYVPKTSGWMIRGDGVAEFNQVTSGTINGDSIKAGTLAVDRLSGGSLNAPISIVGTGGIQLGVSDTGGPAISINPLTGFVADPPGDSFVSIPINGDPVTLRGVGLTATDITVSNNFVLRGVDNTISGTLNLSIGVSPPTASPYVSYGYYNATSFQIDEVNDFGYSMTYDAPRNRFLYVLGTSDNYGSPLTRRIVLVDFSASTVTTLKTMDLTTEGNPLTIKSVGSTLYMLVKRGNAYYMRRYDQATMNFISEFSVFTPTNPNDYNGFSTDGTTLWLQDNNMYSGGTTVNIRAYNLSNPGAGYTTEITLTAPEVASWVGRSFYVGNGDYGAKRYIFNTASTAFVYNSAGVRQTVEDFHVQSTGANLEYDGTQFRSGYSYTYSNPVHSSYSNVTFTSDRTPRSIQVRYSYYDSVGTTHETSWSPASNAMTLPARAVVWGLFSAPALDASDPDAVDSIVPYISVDGGPFYRQTAIVAVSGSNSKYIDPIIQTGATAVSTPDFTNVSNPGIMQSIKTNADGPLIQFKGDGSWSMASFVGMVGVFASYYPPVGWLPCNGQTYYRSQYPALFNAITYVDTAVGAAGQNKITGTDYYVPSVGCRVEGGGIPDGTTVTANNNSSGITLSNNLTATLSSSPIRWIPFGATNVDQFKTPNIEGKTIVGQDAFDTNFGGIARTSTTYGDGEVAHALVTAEMPSHAHTGSGNTGTESVSHTHSISGYSAATTTTGGSAIRVTSVGGLGGGGGTAGTGNTNGISANHSHGFSFTTSYVGSSTAHNNMPPFMTLTYGIKY